MTRRCALSPAEWVTAGARLKHEALICLGLIGAVLLLDPRWPFRLPEAAWWGLLTIGLAAYVAVSRTICD